MNEVEITVSGHNKTGSMWRGLDGSFRDLEGRLRDARGRFKRETDGMAGDAAAAGTRISGGLLGALSGIGSSIASTLGSAGAMAGPEAAAVGIALGVGLGQALIGALIPLVNIAGGLLASLPALVVGGGAGIGTLALGFMGLSDAFNETASAGSKVADSSDKVESANKRVASAMRSVTSAARGVAHAEREVRDAQVLALKAQQDINKAREEAAKRYADLNRQLANTRLDKEAAALDITQAKLGLSKLQGSDPYHGASGPSASAFSVNKKEADLAYRQALQRYDDVSAALDELEQQRSEADSKGIEGSDEVQDALDRQQKATERLADSQERLTVAQEQLTVAQQDLADAQREGAAAATAGGAAAGGAGKQMMELAPAARDVVNAIKSLKPAFEELRLSVQQRLFAGIGDEIRDLAHAWLPQAKESLGSFADTFNGIFKTFSHSAQQPEFITNIGKGIESVRVQVDKIGQALAGPFTTAWGQLSAAASPILDFMGDKISGIIIKFSEWIDKADKSGALQEFMQGAADSLRKIWEVGGDVGSIIGDLWDIFTDSQGAEDSLGILDGIAKAIHGVAVFLDDPKHKKEMGEFVDGLQAFGHVALEVAGWLAEKLIPVIVALWHKFEELNDKYERFYDNFMAKWDLTVAYVSGKVEQLKSVIAIAWNDVVSTVSNKLEEVKWWVTTRWDFIIAYISGIGYRIRSAASGMWDGITDGFRAAMNWIIWKWNSLQFTIGGGSFLGVSIPGTSFGTPDIPYLASGGIGGGLAVVGERGRELVRLPQGSNVYSAEDSARMMADGGGGSSATQVEMKFSGDVDTAFATAFMKLVRTGKITIASKAVV